MQQSGFLVTPDDQLYEHNAEYYASDIWSLAVFGLEGSNLSLANETQLCNTRYCLCMTILTELTESTYHTNA